MRIFRFIIFLLFYFISFSKAFSETLQELSQQLNELSQEIANLSSPNIDKPILSVLNSKGQPVTAIVVENKEVDNMVSYIEFGDPLAKVKNGIVLSENNVKDIAKLQQAQIDLEFAAEQTKTQAAIDVALKNIDKASKFIDESYSKGDIDGAIAALSVIDAAMSDVASNLPQEFRTEIIKEGKKYSAKEMEKITEITSIINKGKISSAEKLQEQIQHASSRGLDVDIITNSILESDLKSSKIQSYYELTANKSMKSNLEDAAKYSGIIGKTPKDVEISINQLNALKAGDARKFRASQIEKFGRAAGLSEKEISKGVRSVLKGDRKTEIEISKNILSNLSSNSQYTVYEYTDLELEEIMKEQIAVEIVTDKIRNSKINFGIGTKNAEIDNLISEVESILIGKIEKEKIDQIKYNLERTKYTIQDKNRVASQVLAEVGGEEYTRAITYLNETKSVLSKLQSSKPLSITTIILI